MPCSYGIFQYLFGYFCVVLNIFWYDFVLFLIIWYLSSLFSFMLMRGSNCNNVLLKKMSSHKVKCTSGISQQSAFKWQGNKNGKNLLINWGSIQGRWRKMYRQPPRSRSTWPRSRRISEEIKGISREHLRDLTAVADPLHGRGDFLRGRGPPPRSRWFPPRSRRPATRISAFRLLLFCWLKEHFVLCVLYRYSSGF